MLNEGLPTRALLAVVPSREAAADLVRRLEDVGVPRDAVRVDQPGDVRTALEAEVQEEITQSFVAPQVGVVYPKETIKASIVLGPPFVAVGAVLGAVLGAFVPVDGWPLWLKIVLGIVTGATMGATIASIVIPAMSVKNPQDPAAAASGVTVRVADASEEALRILVAAEPIRLDRLGDGDRPIDTVVTEEQFTDGGIVEEVAQNFAREARAAPEDKTR